MLKKVERLIAGALFDFAAHLTTLKEEFRVGHSQDAVPLLEALKEWASIRALDLDEAYVTTWDDEIGVSAARRNAALRHD